MVSVFTLRYLSILPREEISSWLRSHAKRIRQSLLVNSCLYAATITAARLSILLFYRRVFSVYATLTHITTFLVFLSVCWWITVEATILSYCVPLEAHWNLRVRGQCIDFGLFFIILSVVELIIDISILCLPIWVIPRLQLNFKNKAILLCIFLLGGL